MIIVLRCRWFPYGWDIEGDFVFITEFPEESDTSFHAVGEIFHREIEEKSVSSNMHLVIGEDDT